MNNKYEELKEEMQKYGFTCHFCHYARDNGSHEDCWVCTNPKWNSNFIKRGRDFCSDFKEIEINVTPFKRVVKNDKDIYYIDYSKHETTTSSDSSSVTTVVKSPNDYIIPEKQHRRKQRGRTAPSRGKE